MQSLVTDLKGTSTRMVDHAARSGVQFAFHHHLLFGLLVCTSVVALLGSVFVSRASATHVQCGAILTQDTTLDSDVECTDAASSTVAITIAADNVKLDLAGYSVKAAPSGTQTGIYATPVGGATSVHGVRILNGTVEGFSGGGVGLSSAVESQVRRLTITTPGAGITVATADGGAELSNCETGVTNCIVRNVISAGDYGIVVSGPKTDVWGNTIRSVPSRSAIYVTGDQPRVSLNHIANCTGGIFVSGYTTYAVVWKNTIDGCAEGAAGGIETSGINAKVRRNVVTGATFTPGINVTDTNGLIAQNDSSGNLGNGIQVQGTTNDPAPNVVRDNNADNNGFYGIQAAAGTFDGGGNTASGNGVQDCSPNLTCGP